MYVVCVFNAPYKAIVMTKYFFVILWIKQGTIQKCRAVTKGRGQKIFPSFYEKKRKKKKDKKNFPLIQNCLYPATRNLCDSHQVKRFFCKVSFRH